LRGRRFFSSEGRSAAAKWEQVCAQRLRYDHATHRDQNKPLPYSRACESFRPPKFGADLGRKRFVGDCEGCNFDEQLFMAAWQMKALRIIALAFRSERRFCISGITGSAPEQ
jgi:hypothetical protein